MYRESRALFTGLSVFFAASNPQYQSKQSQVLDRSYSRRRETPSALCQSCFSTHRLLKECMQKWVFSTPLILSQLLSNNSNNSNNNMSLSIYRLMTSASRTVWHCILNGLALHTTARSLGTSYLKPPLVDEYLHRIKRWYPWKLLTRLGFSSVPQSSARDSNPGHQIEKLTG